MPAVSPSLLPACGLPVRAAGALGRAGCPALSQLSTLPSLKQPQRRHAGAGLKLCQQHFINEACGWPVPVRPQSRGGGCPAVGIQRWASSWRRGRVSDRRPSSLQGLPELHGHPRLVFSSCHLWSHGWPVACEVWTLSQPSQRVPSRVSGRERLQFISHARQVGPKLAQETFFLQTEDIVSAPSTSQALKEYRFN